ncbi:acyltransferase family protein [Methylobacterium sp. A54F]
MLRHRSDIDGLRAVAILPVILFHCGYARIAPGGFVGVDVFFVISGYLITKIVFTEVAEDRYSLVDFYKRRILRIFPALFAVFVFCCVAGSVYYSRPS